MDDLLIHGLQDIYYAEQQIIKSLPKMIDKATNRDLVTGLKAHLEETNKQVERLQKVFEKLGKEASGAQCPAIDGIIKEADEIAGEIEDKAVLDAAIVAAAQAVEHYCPSSDNLRLVRRFEKGGSGSSGLEFKRPASDAASGGLRWLCA
jgi:ferritin-like metal-binding protein YciE